MKTLLTALRATIFGTGFILLWRRVALGLHRRYDTALGFALYIGSFIVLLGFGLFQQSIAILLFTLPWFLLAHLFVILYEGRISAPRLANLTTHIATPTYAFQLIVSPRLSLYCGSVVLRQDQR